MTKYDWSSPNQRYIESEAYTRSIEEARRAFGFPASLPESATLSAAIAEMAVLAASSVGTPLINALSFANPGQDIRGGVVEASTAINAAIASAVATGRNAVMMPPGDYLCDVAKIDIPQGVTLFAYPTMGEYDGNPYTKGARFIRSSAGVSNQPIVQLNTSSACVGIELRWQKSGGGMQGALRMGQVGTFITNAMFRGAIRGTRTGAIDGSTTCYGILFPESADARYFNDIDAYVTECDVTIRMGQLANANKVVLMSREAHLHCDLNAVAGQCIENKIDIRMFAITVLSPAYGLRQHNTNRNKIRGVYEAYGSCFYADDGTSGDDVDITVNESTVSYVPLTSSDARYAKPINVAKYSSMTLPTRTSGDRNVFGRGNKLKFFREITGTLPWMNRVAGTLAAADNNCKSIVQFPADYTKAGLNSFYGRLRVMAYAPFNLGANYVDVEFIYRNTNQSTAAGQLCVLRVTQKGTIITGLYFLTGVAGATPFGIALVGGNSGSNTSFDAISVALDIEPLAYSTNVVTMDALASVAFVSTAITANDVTNGISLLAVADTAV